MLVLWLLTSASTCAQYASSPYDGQPFYGYNQQLEQQLSSSLYPDVPVTYNRQYPAAQSVWSGAPIVVTDEANSLEQQQQQQRGYLPINYYNDGESRRQPDWNSYNYNYNNYNELPTTTRAANHNYNNVPGYVYSGQPQQTQLEQRELLDAADSRRDEEQVVRIGGSRSLAESNGNHNSRNNNNNNYYEPAQSLQRRDFEAKYLQHYADYLRKFPQRLQPLFNTGPPFVDK